MQVAKCLLTAVVGAALGLSQRQVCSPYSAKTCAISQDKNRIKQANHKNNFPPKQAPIPGYNITTLEWNVQVGNETITIPGTVEKVMAHLDVHHPEHAAEIHKAAAANFQMTQSSSSSPLVRRTNYSMGYTYCDLGTPVATIGDISQGIAYLNTVRGSPTNGPGPNNCGQVSCAYDSAIWWCNQVCFLFVPPHFCSFQTAWTLEAL